MRTDILQRYLASHEAIRREKTVLESRLARIKQALAGRAMMPTSSSRMLLAVPRRARRAGKRAANSMSLVEAMRKVTSAKPLTKPEILAAIKKLGYKFASANPMNSINVKLYTRGLFVKRAGGRFAPAK
jgi:hypothetical protein